MVAGVSRTVEWQKDREHSKTLEQTSQQPYDELNPPAEPGLIWRHSAVLILLYPRAGEDYLVLMKRTENVAYHKGQISFPGGAREPEDRDLIATALREANEELGIDPQMVQVLGVMSDFYARVSNFIITPVVGKTQAGGRLRTTAIPCQRKRGSRSNRSAAEGAARSVHSPHRAAHSQQRYVQAPLLRLQRVRDLGSNWAHHPRVSGGGRVCLVAGHTTS